MSVSHSRVKRWSAIAVIAIVVLLLVALIWGLRRTGKLPDSGSVAAFPSITIANYASEIEQARGVLLPLAGKFPGLAVSVGVGRDIVWSEGIGYADIVEETPVSPTSRFRIYSLSKPITAAAAAILWESGRLDLDASVRDYLPSLPDHYAPVTAKHLIGHLSGVRHYRGGEWMKLSQSGCASPSDALYEFVDDPLIHAPGEGFEYSGFGYVLLSAVIESVTGLGFEEFVREAILRPAWMHNTGIHAPSTGNHGAVVFYEPAWFGRVRYATEVDNVCKWGAGAFLSTSDDLVRFGLALLNGKIVGKETSDVIFSTMMTVSSEDTDYGFGWELGADESGRRYASHSGGAIGGKASIYLLRDRKIVVAILANMDGDRLTDEAAKVAEIFALRE